MWFYLDRVIYGVRMAICFCRVNNSAPYCTPCSSALLIAVLYNKAEQMNHCLPAYDSIDYSSLDYDGPAEVH